MVCRDVSGESQPWVLGFDVKEGITSVGYYGEQAAAEAKGAA